jgi:hypothetical protein
MCNSYKPILSVYPAEFDANLNGNLQMCASGFNQLGVPLFKARRIKQLARPTHSNFWAAGFSFSYGDLITECGYDADVGDVFFGEEVY